MRITKVYTKTGDKGKTRLAGGQPVWKNHGRVDAYGDVDELNAAIGLTNAFCCTAAGEKDKEFLRTELLWVQHKLFDIGGLLATKPGQRFKNMPQVQASDVNRLERFIDRLQQDLAPLKEFVLPGGGIVTSMLHQARTVCRRTERNVVNLMRKEPVDAHVVSFLNRLSDMLFVAARWVAKQQGEPEVVWSRNLDSPHT